MQLNLFAIVAAAVAPLFVLAVPATKVASAVAPTFSPVLKDPVCVAFQYACIANEGTWLNKLNCVLLFTCAVPFYDVDSVIETDLWTNKGPYPKASTLPRLSVNIFNQHSSDGKVWTEQNFIDTYYGALSKIGGPYPANVDGVKLKWDSIAAWTGFCKTKAIPYQNLADWFSYSSSVEYQQLPQCP